MASKRRKQQKQTRYEMVLEVLTTGEATAPEIAATLGWTTKQAQDAIQTVHDRGLVEYTRSSNRFRVWRLVTMPEAKLPRTRPVVVPRVTPMRPLPAPINPPPSCVFDRSVSIRSLYEVTT